MLETTENGVLGRTDGPVIVATEAGNVIRVTVPQDARAVQVDTEPPFCVPLQRLLNHRTLVPKCHLLARPGRRFTSHHLQLYGHYAGFKRRLAMAKIFS
jgi:hypothetical protein